MADNRAPIAVLVDREGLGDVMLKTPFLRALRRAFPDREVWWIATHQSAMTELRDLLAPAVANVITHAALDGPIGPLLRRLRRREHRPSRVVRRCASTRSIDTRGRVRFAG